MTYGLHSQRENPDATRAFLLVKKGKCDEAETLLRWAGYVDPRHQVQLIEGFIKFMEAFNQRHKD